MADWRELSRFVYFTVCVGSHARITLHLTAGSWGCHSRLLALLYFLARAWARWSRSALQYGFLNWNEIGQIKKRSLFISTGWLRQFNGFYFSLGAISSHSWPRGWKWHLVRDKNHFIFLTPVSINKYSFSIEAKSVSFWPVVRAIS